MLPDDQESRAHEIIREIEKTAQTLRQARERDVASDMLRAVLRLNDLKEALEALQQPEKIDC